MVTVKAFHFPKKPFLS